MGAAITGAIEGATSAAVARRAKDTFIEISAGVYLLQSICILCVSFCVSLCASFSLSVSLSVSVSVSVFCVLHKTLDGPGTTLNAVHGAA